MAKANDYTKALNDFMGALNVDLSAYKDAFKNSAELAEKMTGVALQAAEKSTEVSAKWTQETIARLGEVSKAKAEPADYTKAMSDYASAAAETAAENMAAFAEIAKRVQMETVELMLAAGKTISEDASAAVKKATDEVTKAAKKATAAAK
jgi:hypothetical protein